MTWRKREIMEMARESGFNVQGDLILDDLGYVTLTVRIEEFARIVREEQQTEVQRLIALVRAQQITIDKLEMALAQPEEEPLHPVHIGVDVTQEGTTVTAFYRKPDAVMEMFYSQFHPMAQPEQEPVALLHEMTPKMMRQVQTQSELGAYAAEHFSGAYDLFNEFWRVAIDAAPRRTWVGSGDLEDSNAYLTKSTWVELTDEDKHLIELKAGITEDDDGYIVSQMFKLTEAKLKEKNT